MTDGDDKAVPERCRDLIVVGGSAGALAPLRTMLGELDASFPATVLVVLHGPAAGRSHLAAILERESALAVIEPRDGERLRPGAVLVAPPDRHMLVMGNHVHLRRGPTENGFRPAIDPLFRSAALSATSRAIGVILSGTLDDGASGLRAIKRAGGIAMVQDPTDAEYGDMPLAADRAASADEMLPASMMGARLRDLAGRPAPAAPAPPNDLRIEVLIAGLEDATMRNENRLGNLSPFSCPDCNGNLWEIADGDLTRFRCHTGHAYTSAVLDGLQEEELERRLYEVLRAQRERAELLRRMADEGGPRTQEAMRDRAERYEEDAAMIERVLREGHAPEPEDGETMPLGDDVEA